jgi:hypothetical protein
MVFLFLSLKRATTIQCTQYSNTSVRNSFFRIMMLTNNMDRGKVLPIENRLVSHAEAASCISAHVSMKTPMISGKYVLEYIMAR